MDTGGLLSTLRGDRARTALVFLSSGGLLAFAAAMFWYQDWQYSLPTPRPPELQQPPLGFAPELPKPLLLKRGPPGKPLLLHFFNPRCPCSRFNLDHVRDLIKLYRSSVTFVAVVQGEGSEQELKDAYTSCKLDADFVVDSGGAIGRHFGIYSTPQAVLLDTGGHIYYRGNYNVARYCNDPKTEFARTALKLLLAGRPRPSYPVAAITAYGCPLPKRAPRGSAQ